MSVIDSSMELVCQLSGMGNLLNEDSQLNNTQWKKRDHTKLSMSVPFHSFPLARGHQKSNLLRFSTEVFVIRIQHRLQLSVSFLVVLPSELYDSSSLMNQYMLYLQIHSCCALFGLKNNNNQTDNDIEG